MFAHNEYKTFAKQLQQTQRKVIKTVLTQSGKEWDRDEGRNLDQKLLKYWKLSQEELCKFHNEPTVRLTFVRIRRQKYSTNSVNCIRVCFRTEHTHTLFCGRVHIVGVCAREILQNFRLKIVSKLDRKTRFCGTTVLADRADFKLGERSFSMPV